MKKFKLLFISLVIVIVGTFTFLRPAFAVPVYIDTLLTISTSEIKNPLSAGNEIRIKDIMVNGKGILHQIPIDDGWKLEGDMLMCYENDGIKHSISLPLKRVSDIAITFIGQKGSGNVSVSVENEETAIDLYRDSDWEEVAWTYNASTEFSPFSRLDIMIEMVLIIWLLLSTLKFWKSCKCS